ncbi:MAG: ester cyclase [Bacteroidetes bacterium]|nr:ester cyclase [Bacteroidota bacterium]
MKKLYIIFVGALLSVIMVGKCYSQEKLSVTNNRKLAFAWIEAINKHDTSAIAFFYDDLIQLESPNWEGTKHGKAELDETNRRYFSSTPDLRYELSNIVATDSAVVIEYRSYGTLLNPEQNTPAYMRGKKYSLQNCTRMDIRNGKIIKQASYFDQVAFLRQMGFFDR